MLMTKRAVDAVDRSYIAEITEDLVNIPSPTGQENSVAQYYAGKLRELGLELELQEVEAERPNVIGRYRGQGGGKNVLLCGHFDTSTTPDDAVAGIGHAPRYTQEGEWAYGLGISNMKNALAIYAGAVRAIMESKTAIRGDIVIGAVVGEIEKAPIDKYKGKAYRGGGSGARYMVHHGVTADVCIDGEPTGMRLQLGNTGYIFARITTKGVPSHTFSRASGRDAIAKMEALIPAIRKWEEVYQKRHPHPFMLPLIGIGAIEGGFPFKPSICPAPFCHLYLHITTIPGTKPMTIHRQLNEVLLEQAAKDPELEFEIQFYLVSDGYEVSKDSEVAEAVQQSHKEVFKREVIFPEPARYSVSSDCSPIFQYGIPGVTYGAGGITPAGVYSMYDGAKGEVLGLDNLYKTTQSYALALIDLCNQTPE
jgi:acetylornithine deacetylase/succinyl-diaminopimelate desuccinylase-like protein